MSRSVLALAAGLALLAASPLALAWSALGHRMVGELAQRHLDPAAQAEVRRLLAGEPDPSLAGIATWADELRHSDPVQFKRTARWHYVEMPDSCRYAPEDCPDGQCVVAAIERETAILADRSQPLAARREALMFVVHFVGDVHQPLHANSRPDKGGNTYQISLRTDLEPEAYARDRYHDGVMGTNLHAVWDYYILGSEKIGLEQYADRLDAQPWPPLPGQDGSGPAAWAGESCRLAAAPGFYPDGHRLDQRYLDAQRPLAEQRIRQAAWRLTQLLDNALAPAVQSH